jgi:cholesterol oxidase
MNTIKTSEEKYDFVIIGSGFGGSVSALRLTEKGYKVLMIEKGKSYSPEDFPKTNWNLSNWLWLPSIRFYGFFKMTFFRHVGVLSGVGVGGGSLVYANTLPRPRKEFFNSGNWAGLADWENELSQYYTVAEKMLGANLNPKLYDSDNTLLELSKQLGKEEFFEPTKVSVFFGEPEKVVPDPYFNGEGPAREGCSFCGGCMTGCRHNAKNTLDKNYLYLAEKRGAQILSDHFVKSIIPLDSIEGKSGYKIIFRKTSSFIFSKKKEVLSKGVILAGGVLGTVRLLLDMKRSYLPGLSEMVGNGIRTNNESLVLIDSRDFTKDFSKGIAIGSIFPPDENSHLEPVRYGSGSGFWKLLGVPLTHGRNVFSRTGKLFYHLIRHPFSWLHFYFTKDFAKQSVILLFMQHINSTLKLKRGLFGLKSNLTDGHAPTAFMPESKLLAEQVSGLIKGKPFVLITEAITGIPTTAHILGGSVIGKSISEGVINTEHQVFGYSNMYVCDGAAVSSNPGVNPALTITAMTERAMNKIPEKLQNESFLQIN